MRTVEIVRVYDNIYHVKTCLLAPPLFRWSSFLERSYRKLTSRFVARKVATNGDAGLYESAFSPYCDLRRHGYFTPF